MIDIGCWILDIGKRNNIKHPISIKNHLPSPTICDMKRTEFENLVSEALDDLPEEFQKIMENVAVTVEDEPSWETLNEMRISPPGILLGLYRGVPLRRRGRGYFNMLPDKIIIYQRPIESICRGDEEIKEKVREVVMHEIGHYFGLSDSALRKIERESLEEQRRISHRISQKSTEEEQEN